jgi:hypothetical protein
MHGPTCIVWANLTPFSLKLSKFVGDNASSSRHSGVYRHKKSNKWTARVTHGGRHEHVGLFGTEVRKTPSWPRSRANFSLLWSYSFWNAWANWHLLGQPNTFLARRRRPRRAAMPAAWNSGSTQTRASRRNDRAIGCRRSGKVSWSKPARCTRAAGGRQGTSW